MMDVVSIIVAVTFVAFIAILVVRNLMKGHSRSIERKIASLGVPLIKKDISMLKIFMPLLCLDGEKVRRTLFEFAEANNLEELRYYMRIGVLREDDINMLDNDYQTFGHVAVRNRNKHMFNWFLENGGKTDIRGGKNNKTVDDILNEDSEVQMWRVANEKQTAEKR